MPLTKDRPAGQSAARTGLQRGFTMLEVLIALLILVIGLLGLAGLLVTTQQGEVEAYQRKQATVLVQDMINRLTANPVAAPCYAKTDKDTGAPALGTGYTGDFLCPAGSAPQGERGQADLTAWHNALLGTDERKGSSAGADIGGIIEARGCVTRPDPTKREYVVSVAWRGLAPTLPPPATSTFACGKGKYLDASGSAVEGEKLRRVISVTIQIADLKGV